LLLDALYVFLGEFQINRIAQNLCTPILRKKRRGGGGDLFLNKKAPVIWGFKNFD
jgi:hypothetical protein